MYLLQNAYVAQTVMHMCIICNPIVHLCKSILSLFGSLSQLSLKFCVLCFWALLKKVIHLPITTAIMLKLLHILCKSDQHSYQSLILKFYCYGGQHSWYMKNPTWTLCESATTYIMICTLTMHGYLHTSYLFSHHIA